MAAMMSEISSRERPVGMDSSPRIIRRTLSLSAASRSLLAQDYEVSPSERLLELQRLLQLQVGLRHIKGPRSPFVHVIERLTIAVVQDQTTPVQRLVQSDVLNDLGTPLIASSTHKRYPGPATPFHVFLFLHSLTSAESHDTVHVSGNNRGNQGDR